MKNLMIFLLFSILLLGCQDEEIEAESKKAPHISQKLKDKIEKPMSTTGLKRKKTTSELLGITVEGGKIIIDTRQTKDFFHGIGEKIKDSASRIEESLKKEKVESPDETGISITETTIHIDLNKTKNFMKKWIKSMETVVKEIDETMSDIEKSLP